MTTETSGSAGRARGTSGPGRTAGIGIAALVAVFLTAGSAEARPSWHLGARLGGFEASQASSTWDAIYGETMIQYGLQVEARFTPGWFVALSIDRGSVNGQTVAPLPGGGTVPTGVDTELTMTPIHLTVGGIAWSDRAWQLYYGGGLSQLQWEDKNDVAPFDASDGGFHVVAGLRRELRRVALAGEARWSSFPNAIGEGGASAFFGEDNWGGLSAHLVVSFRLGR